MDYNNWTFGGNRIVNQFTSAGTSAFDTITLDTAANELTYNEYLDWLPKACTREKYLPTWHLVKSYGR